MAFPSRKIKNYTLGLKLYIAIEYITEYIDYVTDRK